MDLDGTTVKSEEFWIYLIEKTIKTVSKNQKFSFTEEDIIEYIDETEAYILPLLDHIKKEYPQYYDAAFVLKYQILSLIESIKAAVLRL